MKKIFLAFFVVLFCSCTPHHFDFKGVELDGTIQQFTRNAIKYGWEPTGYVDSLPVFKTTLFGEKVIVTPLLYADEFVYGVAITNGKIYNDFLPSQLHKEMVNKFSGTGVIPQYEEGYDFHKTTFTFKKGRIVIYTCSPTPTTFGASNFVYYIDNQNYDNMEYYQKNDM